MMRNFRVEDTIIYEDGEILVCHKPAGIAVQNARMGALDLENALRNYLAVRSGENSRKIPYLAVIHRLDQPVEGVLVFGKTPGAARELSRQMAAGEMCKKYLAVTGNVQGKKYPAVTDCVLDKKNLAETAVVSGQEAGKEYLLIDYLKKDGRTNTSTVVPKGTAGSKEARLSYKILQEAKDSRIEGGRKTLLEIHLDTGRHHQIRVQMAHAGMPLLGDRKYNPSDKSNVPLGLCSCELTLLHPSKKKKMKFEISPRGEAFEGFHE